MRYRLRYEEMRWNACGMGQMTFDYKTNLISRRSRNHAYRKLTLALLPFNSDDPATLSKSDWFCSQRSAGGFPLMAAGPWTGSLASNATLYARLLLSENASGAVGMLEIAEAYVRAAAQGHSPKRSLLFAAWGSEERCCGPLLGAWAWVEHPQWPLDKALAVLNMDMIGRNQEVPGKRWPSL